MQPFKYMPSLPIKEWGCHFDSMLELKYALSVRKDYEVLRSRISIYYDPKSLRPTETLQYKTMRYSPDFLIRHKLNNLAFLVEIKPRVFENEKQLVKRRLLAERYIEWKNYDWQFKVVYDDEIRLDEENQRIYNDYYQYKRQCLNGEARVKIKGTLPAFNLAVDEKKMQFLLFGNFVNH